MKIIQANFNNIDHFNGVLENWDLDFKLLSKNDFSASLNIFSSSNIIFGRTKLFGKIEQKGMTPKGFRTIVIPYNYDSEYVWLHKKVTGKNLLIFPKNGSLDAVSFSGFDNYIISIEENRLFEIIDQLDYKSCKKIFSGDEQVLHLSKAFATSFHLLAEKFLNTKITNQKWHSLIINDIIHSLLTYIEETKESTIHLPSKRKNIALRMAVDIINNYEEKLIPIQDLSRMVGLSDRTLLSAFKSKYQVSPSDYIKAIRLNNVRRDLFLLKGQDTAISFIAGKYHFWHMGQFAQDFKNHFGVLPSDI